jgi:DNA replication licensing factor MCM2
MHLREYVQMEDVDTAIRVMLDSFTHAQRYSVKTALRKKFNKFIVFSREHNDLLAYLLEEMFKEAHMFDGRVTCEEFERRAKDWEVDQFVLEFYDADVFVKAGFRIKDGPRGVGRVILHDVAE